MKIPSFARNALAAVVLASLAAPTAFAQDATLTEARRLIDSQRGQGRAAFELLAPLEEARAGDPAFDYLLGLAASDAGEYTRAVFAFERVLAVQPSHPQARAELARAYFLMGENRSARAEFEAVKASKPPAEVESTIDRFLSALDARQAGSRSGLTGYLEMGFGYDSNVNTATGSSSFASAFGAGNLTAGSTGRSDTFMLFNGGISGRLGLGERFTLSAGANFAGRLNSLAGRGEAFNPAAANGIIQGIDVFDSLALDANVGLAYVQGDHEFSAAVQRQDFTLDNTRFRESTGYIAQWRYAIDAKQQVTAYWQSSRLKYINPWPPNPYGAPAIIRSSDRNAVRETLGVAWARSFDVPLSPTVFAGAYGGEERLMQGEGAQFYIPEFGHNFFGVRLGGQIVPREKWAVFANVSQEDRHYGFPSNPIGPQSIGGFIFNRVDREINLRVGAVYEFAKNWSVSPSLALTDAHSNVPINKYRRNLVQATIRYDFR